MTFKLRSLIQAQSFLRFRFLPFATRLFLCVLYRSYNKQNILQNEINILVYTAKVLVFILRYDLSL